MPKLLDLNWIWNKSRLMYAPSLRRSIPPWDFWHEVAVWRRPRKRPGTEKQVSHTALHWDDKVLKVIRCDPSHQGDQSQMSKAAAVTYSNLSNAPLPSKSASRKQNTYTEAVDFWDLLGLWRHSQHVVKSCSRTLFHNINSHRADGRLW